MPSTPGWGQQPCPCSRGWGDAERVPQHWPRQAGLGHSRRCPDTFCHSGAWLPRSSLCSQENFGLNCVPSLLLSCGHHSQRRVMCQEQGAAPHSPACPQDSPPSPSPSRSPTISPTDLPASSPPRCSTPFSRAAALRRTPLHWGTRSHTKKRPQICCEEE